MQLNRSFIMGLLMLAGCQASGPQGLVPIPVPVGVAGLVSDNGAGLISNNSGSLTGVIRGPGAGLIANNSAGLLGNNAAGLIANNAGSLIANNGGGLIANSAGTFRLLLAGEAIAPVPNATVTARNELGEVLAVAARTDADGRYTLAGLKPSGPVVFVSATYSGGGVEAVLSTAAAAPREATALDADMDPATTLLAKKLSEAARAGAVGLTAETPAMVADARQALSDAMSEKAAIAAVIYDDNLAARVFDAMLEVSPPLRTAVTDSLAAADLAGVLVKTPARIVPQAPSPKPVAPPAPLATAAALEWFDEVFAAGWNTDGTWNGEAGPSSDVTPFSGATAIAWTTGGRGGFKFTAPTAVNTAGYQTLTFALRAGQAGAAIKLQALDGTRALGHALDLASYGGKPPEGAWKRYDVPLADLAAADRSITGFMLTEAAGQDLPTSYLDRIGLER